MRQLVRELGEDRGAEEIGEGSYSQRRRPGGTTRASLCSWRGMNTLLYGTSVKWDVATLLTFCLASEGYPLQRTGRNLGPNSRESSVRSRRNELELRVPGRIEESGLRIPRKARGRGRRWSGGSRGTGRQRSIGSWCRSRPRRTRNSGSLRPEAGSFGRIATVPGRRPPRA